MSKYLDFVIETAFEAGSLLMTNYGKVHGLDWHTRTNFKIEVDKKSDELIRKRIKEFYPDHNIFSEEDEGLKRKSDLSWVVDPLDGTIPYTLGFSDHFSVAISLARGERPIIGVIYAPKRNELYFAEDGRGAFCNNNRIKISDETDINRVVIGLDYGKETKDFKRSSVASLYQKLLGPNGITAPVSFACASVPLCLTAKGNLHAYMALSLEPWDMAAAVVINREAGARVTNLKGREWQLRDASILSANPKLHKRLLRLIRR